MLEQATNLLHKDYTKQIYQIIDLDKFEGVMMNQLLDHISI
ncbi:Site-specific recombinase [Streptococcus mitis]|uniref:Site-specific recombinase n=1 Tax=Streptococcus mitis TaxID=28037 RepID=A0A139PRD7_STRMT|nr:Site-specific recombinase [Streptococcus mitis]